MTTPKRSRKGLPSGSASRCSTTATRLWGSRLDDVVHDEQRGQPKGETCGGEGADERGVEPQRRAADPAEMDEVGEDVRRVGQEEQPGRTEHPQQRAGTAATVNGSHADREYVGNPREEEVPGEEEEGGLADPVQSDGDQPDRGEGQDREGDGEAGQPVRGPSPRGGRHTRTLRSTSGSHQPINAARLPKQRRSVARHHRPLPYPAS